MGVRSLGNALASFGYKFGTTGLEAVGAPPPPPAGITASGGIINDYEDSGTQYRAHVFTSSGTFAISDLGSISSTVEYLVIGGGGGGGSRFGGGGGAGGYRTASNLPVSAQSYTVTVGGGGAGGVYIWRTW